ncbi:MAG TPA: hypothetical protein VFK57_25070 [Vicinamibacterales bacterium]|nr:hypothetical protein [Vicinamibacterales bacterium]
MRARLLRLTLMALALQPAAVSAQQPEAGAPAVAWRYSMKSSALLARLPDAPPVSAGGTLAAGFWRFRLEPQPRLDGPIGFELAFEQRIQVRSSASGAGAMFAPSGGDAPYRIAQLDWTVASGGSAEWRAEIDRAAVRLRLPRMDVTAGRQAIGWGRGTLFGAVDLFAPFTPLEVDREWRRGVDAVRAEIKITDRVSMDAVAAFDRTRAGSTGAVRVRGYSRRIDLEVLGGSRAGEPFAGTAASAAIGDMEFHADASFFRADGAAVGKAVAGGSYRIPLGKGIFTCAEYHYSGFGARASSGIAAALGDPRFRARYLRGDTQILGRHALAVLASYEHSAAVSASAQWLHSPSDASGLVVPSITYTVDDRWSVLSSIYLPYGRGGRDGVAREFGATPVAAFLQVRMYR